MQVVPFFVASTLLSLLLCSLILTPKSGSVLHDLFDLGSPANVFMHNEEDEIALVEAFVDYETLESDKSDQLFLEACALLDQPGALQSDVTVREVVESTSRSGEQGTTSQFGALVNKDYLSKLKVSAVPQKAQNQTSWALSRWIDWAKNRNKLDPREIVPLEIEMTNEQLVFWMQRFIAEVHKKRGKRWALPEKYPPETIYAVVVSLQRYSRKKRKCPEVNIFLQPIFNDTLDAEMKVLPYEGVPQQEAS